MEVLITEKGKAGAGNRMAETRKVSASYREAIRKRETGNWKGRADNYKQVCVLGKAKIGERLKARIIGSNYGSLFGKRI
jgi:hypothetical protein